MKKNIFTFLMTMGLCLMVQMALGQEQSKLLAEGAEHFSRKDYKDALKYFQKEYKKNPSVEAKFWIAHTYAEMKEIKQAQTLFLEILRSGHTGPERSMSLVNLGICYRSLGQFDSAYAYFDQAIKEYPEMASAYFNRGQLLYEESKFREAKEHFDKTIELAPNEWWHYQKRLEVCFAIQDFDSALNDLIMVKKLKPDMKTEFNLAYCYSMLKKYPEADSVFQLIYNDKDAHFLNNFGMNKYHMGKTKEGKEIIMKALAIKPDNSYAYLNLAIIAISENDLPKACEYLQKAKSLGFERQYGNEVNELLLKNCR